METMNKVADHAKRNKILWGVVIVIIVLVIIYAAWKFFDCSYKSGTTSAMSNLTTGSNNPNWQLGNQMSQAAVASPMMEQRFGGGSCCCSGGSEGMCGSGGCGSYAYPSGAGSCYGMENGPGGMSHGAMAELDAQVQAGNFAATSPAWGKMQNAIDSVDTRSSALSDGTLSAMLYSGCGSA